MTGLSSLAWFFLLKAAWRRSSKVNQVLQGYYAYCQFVVAYCILALLEAVGFSVVRIYTACVSQNRAQKSASYVRTEKCDCGFALSIRLRSLLIANYWRVYYF